MKKINREEHLKGNFRCEWRKFREHLICNAKVNPERNLKRNLIGRAETIIAHLKQRCHGEGIVQLNKVIVSKPRRNA